jgi:hypothetical protein
MLMRAIILTTAVESRLLAFYLLGAVECSIVAWSSLAQIFPIFP